MARPPSANSILRNTKNSEKKEIRTPIGTEIYLPNHSGITSHPEMKKIVSSIDFTPYWKSDGTSTATGNWDIGANNLDVGGDFDVDGSTTMDATRIDGQLDMNGNINMNSNLYDIILFDDSQRALDIGVSGETQHLTFDTTNGQEKLVCNFTLALGDDITMGDWTIEKDSDDLKISPSGGSGNLVLDTTNAGGDVEIKVDAIVDGEVIVNDGLLGSKGLHLKGYSNFPPPLSKGGYTAHYFSTAIQGYTWMTSTAQLSYGTTVHGTAQANLNLGSGIWQAKGFQCKDNEYFRVGTTITDGSFYSDGTNAVLSAFTSLRLGRGVTSYIEIDNTGNLTFVGGAAGLPYGGLSVFDNTTATTITTMGTKVQFGEFDTVDAWNNTTPSIGNDDITILKAGDYDIKCFITADSVAGGGATFSFDIYKNNGATLIAHGHRDFSGGGGEVGSVTIGRQIALSVNDTVELWITNTTGTENIVLSDVVLNLTQIGG
jgi:hypothetical protein